MSTPQPSYGPVTSPTAPLQHIPYQVESPLYVYKQREATTLIDQQRFHDEALQWYGEECVVRLLWRAEDAQAGLVTYCLTCQDSPNPTAPSTGIQTRVSQVYRQTGNSYCPDCYGTTFTGGFQPTAYHLYMLATDTEDNRRMLQTGQFWRQNPQVQFSWFPQIRQGDLVVRITQWDGDTPLASSTVFQVSNVQPITVRTGPGPSAITPYRTGTQPFSQNQVIVNQICTLENLPPGHPYYQVPFV